MVMPDDFDYDRVQGLSNEVRLKLKPSNLQRWRKLAVFRA